MSNSQINSMKPKTYRDAMKDMALSLSEDDHCKAAGKRFIEQERWLQKYNRIANAPEETDKERTLKHVQDEIIAIRNEIIDISAKISEDDEENLNAFLNINPELVTEADSKNGVFVKLSYLAISMDKEYKAVYNSQPKV